VVKIVTKKIKHIGSPIRIDYEKQTITFQFDFVDPDQFKMTEEIIKKKKYCEIAIKYINDEIINASYIRMWYGSIGTILRHRGIIPDSENVKVLDKQLRETIFPVKYVDIGMGQLVPDVPAIHDLSNEEFLECCLKLQERHSYINWEEFRL